MKGNGDDRRARATVIAGAALIVAAFALFVLPATPGRFWVWLVGMITGVGLIATGLNALRMGLGSLVAAAVGGLVVLLFIAVPVVGVLVMGSLQRPVDVLSGPHLIPPDPSVASFVRLFEIPYIVSGLRTSLITSLLATTVTTLLALLGAYAISALRFPGRAAMYRSVMFLFMVPGIALLVPLVALLRQIALVDTVPGMIIAHIALITPIVLWLLVGAFETLDADIEHAARIDGASRLQALRRVVMPLTAPSVAIVMIFGFILSWNELLFSRVLSVSSTQMLAPGIVNLMDPIARQESVLSAGGLVASVPVLVLVLILQRFLVRRVGEGALK